MPDDSQGTDRGCALPAPPSPAALPDPRRAVTGLSPPARRPRGQGTGRGAAKLISGALVAVALLVIVLVLRDGITGTARMLGGLVDAYNPLPGTRSGSTPASVVYSRRRPGDCAIVQQSGPAIDLLIPAYLPYQGAAAAFADLPAGQRVAGGPGAAAQDQPGQGLNAAAAAGGPSPAPALADDLRLWQSLMPMVRGLAAAGLAPVVVVQSRGAGGQPSANPLNPDTRDLQAVVTALARAGARPVARIVLESPTPDLVALRARIERHAVVVRGLHGVLLEGVEPPLEDAGHRAGAAVDGAAVDGAAADGVAADGATADGPVAAGPLATGPVATGSTIAAGGAGPPAREARPQDLPILPIALDREDGALRSHLERAPWTPQRPLVLAVVSREWQPAGLIDVPLYHNRRPAGLGATAGASGDDDGGRRRHGQLLTGADAARACAGLIQARSDGAELLYATSSGSDLAWPEYLQALADWTCWAHSGQDCPRSG